MALTAYLAIKRIQTRSERIEPDHTELAAKGQTITVQAVQVLGTYPGDRFAPSLKKL